MHINSTIHLITNANKDLVKTTCNSPFDHRLIPFATNSHKNLLYTNPGIKSILLSPDKTQDSLIFPPVKFHKYQLYPKPLQSTPVKIFVQFFFNFILWLYCLTGANRLNPGPLNDKFKGMPGNNHHEFQQCCWFFSVYINVYLNKSCLPYDFIMRKFFPGPLQVKRTIPMTHGDLPRSRMFPALRQHLFLFLTAKTREETQRKEKKVGNWQLARREGVGDVGLLVSNSNRWVSPGGVRKVRKGTGES